MNYAADRITPRDSPLQAYKQTVRFCDRAYRTYIEPAYHYRGKGDVKLLYFGETGAWLNMSPNPNKPAWIPKRSTVGEMIIRRSTREQVMQYGSSIEVLSNHRLRSLPSTDSEILHVLDVNDQGEHAIIEPVEVDGDWMKVMYSSPNPYLVGMNNAGANSKPVTVIEGWIKWRRSPGNEYVKVQYESL